MMNFGRFERCFAAFCGTIESMQRLCIGWLLKHLVHLEQTIYLSSPSIKLLNLSNEGGADSINEAFVVYHYGGADIPFRVTQRDTTQEKVLT